MTQKLLKTRKKTITWNEDSNKGVQSVYYITFGHVANGTDIAPTNGASATFKGNLDDMFAFNGTGSASANGFALSDVTEWGSLSYNTGATGFHSSVSWHLDGDIRVYTVAYANGLDEASEETVADMPKKIQLLPWHLHRNHSCSHTRRLYL